MFDIGGPEFFFLVILALLIFGPRRLPEIGRTVGSFAAHLRRAVSEFQGTLEREVRLEDMKQAAGDMKALRDEVTGMARGLTGVGPPPYADPARRSVAAGTIARDPVLPATAESVDVLPPADAVVAPPQPEPGLAPEGEKPAS